MLLVKIVKAQALIFFIKGVGASMVEGLNN